ncbi:hypothetical protein D3C78_720930 [compost metagenome]
MVARKHQVMGADRTAQRFAEDRDELAARDVVLGEQRTLQGEAEAMAGRFQAHVGAVEAERERRVRQRQPLLGEPLRPLHQRGFGENEIAAQQVLRLPDRDLAQQLRRRQHSQGLVADSAYFEARPVRITMTDIQIDLGAPEMQGFVGAGQVDLNIRIAAAKLLQAW